MKPTDLVIGNIYSTHNALPIQLDRINDPAAFADGYYRLLPDGNTEKYTPDTYYVFKYLRTVVGECVKGESLYLTEKDLEDISSLEAVPVMSSPLTDDEKDVMDKLANAWSAFLQLSVQHPMHQQEFCLAIHAAQRIIMSRPVAREMGWDKPIVKDEHNHNYYGISTVDLYAQGKKNDLTLES